MPYQPAPWHGVIVGYARRRMLRARWQRWRCTALALLITALLMGTAIGLAWLVTELMWGAL
ncbi:hypothetical protein ABFV80_002333 [Vandammella animalimorsus]|uniref:hypothetical protein n=1 Tax=Vandammella animalimorsus TaxID=2029117 RepID=UPI00325B708A